MKAPFFRYLYYNIRSLLATEASAEHRYASLWQLSILVLCDRGIMADTHANGEPPEYQQIDIRLPPELEGGNVGKSVLMLPKQFKAFYGEVVDWNVMESWADSSKSDMVEFTPVALAASLDILTATEEELARHTGSYTAIQHETIANGN